MGSPDRAAVIGGGVGGLLSALALSRAGVQVELIERDPWPDVADVEAAFLAERRGAPQVHQTHGFLARLQVVLRERFPDVFADLLAAGGSMMSTTLSLGDPQPGDEDLAVLIIRRTTFEWVLRKAVARAEGIHVRAGSAVVGLASSEPRTVTGVHLEDGSTVAANFVIAANGRRAPVPAWVAAVGGNVPETVRESGLMYVTRWYRLPPERALALDPKLGGDLGFVKYLGVPGDGQTLSVTLAISASDDRLRRALAEPDRFDHACRILPGPDRFFVDGPLEPIGGVRPMGGLLNRIRTFVDADGEPAVRGFHAVGDAHTCTNPLYGRGCSLALVQAVLLADAHRDVAGDAVARAKAYEAGNAREVAPWFEVSVQMDRLGADPAGSPLGGSAAGADGAEGGPEAVGGDGGARAIAAVFVAAATDPVIGRAMVRFWNLMATPAELMADAELLARIAQVVAEPDRYRVERPEGPTRAGLLAALGEGDDAAVPVEIEAVS